MLTRFHLEPRFGVFDDLARRLWEDWDVDVPAAVEAAASPRLRLQDAGDKLVLTLDAPGMQEKDFTLELKGMSLTLAGERKLESPKGYEGRRQERTFAKFARTLTLPGEVDAAAATASLKDGVLTVTLPKIPEAKPRTIPIRAGGLS
jgi:HSP20 family protein